MEKVGQKDVRSHKTIIGKGKKVGSSAKSCEVWKKLTSGIEIFSHIVSDGHMLRIPVCFRAKPGSIWDQLPDEKKAGYKGNKM